MYVYLSWPSTVQVLNWIAFHLGINLNLAVPKTANVPVLTPSEIFNGLVDLFSGKGLPDLSTYGWEMLTLKTVLGISLIFTFVIWLIGSQVGLAYNVKDVKMPKLKRLSLHVEQLLFSPFVGMIETFPALVGLVEFVFRPAKNEDFHVIKK
jgi:hypothetical protein